MAQTVSITDQGNGQFVIKDSDQQTRVVSQAQALAEAAKSGVKITSSGGSSLPSPNATGYGPILTQSYPTEIGRAHV